MNQFRTAGQKEQLRLVALEKVPETEFDELARTMEALTEEERHWRD